jgi:hypothetical protein
MNLPRSLIQDLRHDESGQASRRRILRPSILILSLLLPVIASSDQFVRTLRVSIYSLAIRPLGGTVPSRVVFTGNPLTATVTLAVAVLPGATVTPDGGVDLPSARWWEHLAWDVRRDGATASVPVRSSLLSHDDSSHRADENGKLRVQAGERLSVRLRLAELSPGAYTVRVGIAGLRSEPFRVLISTGDENDDLRREYARYKTLNSPTTSALKKNLLELAALDPLNAGPWIRLGDISLPDGSVEEIRGYYDHAISVLDQRRQLYAAKGETRVVDAIQAERDTVDQVRALVPRYVANRVILQLKVELEGGKRYILAERATGRVVQTIAVRPPASEIR